MSSRLVLFTASARSGLRWATFHLEQGLRERIFFYLGVAMITMATLMLQIIQTRILSVTTWYHLAFLSISMAMFGMTAGAVYVYFKGDSFREKLSYHLCLFSGAFAVATAAGMTLQLSLVTAVTMALTTAVAWTLLIIVLALPYFFSGVVVALALTRSPFPVGRVYAVDLVGAAAGCLGVLVALALTDAPSVVLGVATLIALGAIFFSFSGIGEWPRPDAGWKRIVVAPALLFGVLAVLTFLNSGSRYGIQPVFVKERVERSDWLFLEWNSFSRIRGEYPVVRAPQLWGASPTLPSTLLAQQIRLNIDGEAGTTMFQFNGTDDALGYLQYDLTNLAYFVRRNGKAGIVGVGGGRDVLSAYAFGFRDIAGVELNPIFIRLLTDPNKFRQFSGLADLPGVELIVDEGRSWYTRSRDRFDLIQMSLIDTWAATGAGAFTLSENGLYTVEAWTVFLSRLKPDGLFTVSRWYGGEAVDETGRTIALAQAALLNMDAKMPSQHIFVAATAHLANTIVSPTPLSAETLDRLHAEAERLQFKVLLSPRQRPSSPVISGILDARTNADLERFTDTLPMDLSPPTDNRPFFFNQLRLSQAPGMALGILRRGTSGVSHGVITGNLVATITLAMLLVFSAVLVLAAIVIPLRHTVRDVPRQLAVGGTLYFLFLGVAFMFIEIGLLQRLSVFLGHPTYSLAVVLFSLILATGAGSFLSERVLPLTGRAIAVWSISLSAYILLLPIWLSHATDALAAEGIFVRSLLSFAVILPGGLLMGFGFPTGMRLVDRISDRPKPWFWGINGAAGVLAATLAVVCSMNLGINATLAIGGVLYLGLVPAAYLIGGFASKEDIFTTANSTQRATL